MTAAKGSHRASLRAMLLVVMLCAGSGLAASEVYYAYAPVIQVEPLVEQRSVPVEVEVCELEPSGDQRRQDRDLAGSLRTSEPGLDIGTAIRRDTRRRETRELVQHCRHVTRYETREEVVAYRVVYRYRGRDYVRRMREHPGERVRIEVRVKPAGSWRAGSASREFWPPTN